MSKEDQQSPGAKSIQTASIESEFELESSQSYFMEQIKYDEDSEQNIMPKRRFQKNPKRSNLNQSWNIQNEENLIELHKKNGNKWTLLAKSFPGMSENSIKNRFYSRLRKSIRKLNKSIEKLKFKQYNKFKLNIIFQLSNISESKLLEKDKVSPQIFHFYKDFLYDLIEFSNQNIDLNRVEQTYNQTKSEIESFILPLIALQNLFRLVRGERAAKGKKKNIAYLRQFSFKLSLQVPIVMVITKENTYLQNLNENPNIEVSEQYAPQQTQDYNFLINTESSFQTLNPLRKSSLSQSSNGKELPDENQKDTYPKMNSLNTFIEEDSYESKTKHEMWKDYFGCQMKEIDFYSHEDAIHQHKSQFNLINMREMDFIDDEVCL